MKEILQKLKTVIAFDFPFDKNLISAQFVKTHISGQREFPEWSTTSTGSVN